MTLPALRGPIRHLIALLITVTASLPSFAEEGTVLDKTTAKPISGAVVVAIWRGIVGVLVQGASQCFKAEVAITDAKGRFEVSSFSWNLDPFMGHRQRDFLVVARGYWASAAWNPGDPHVLMEPRTGSKSDQFKRFPRFQPLGCRGAGSAMLPYLKLLYAEMDPLAESNEERLTTSHILYELESLELGDDVALQRSATREAEIVRKSK